MIDEIIQNAECGNAEAQFLLGMRYDKGEGVAPDCSKAIEWYTKAAEQGYVKAKFFLGVCYLGNLAVQDYNVAVKWFTEAAKQGTHQDLEFFQGTFKRGFNKLLRNMIIGAVIYGVILGAIAWGSGNVVSVLIAGLIGALFGLGIDPFLRALLRYLFSMPKTILNEVKRGIDKEGAWGGLRGLAEGIGGTIIIGFFKMSWESIKSPIIAIRDLLRALELRKLFSKK